MISSESESDDDVVIHGARNNGSDRNISRNMSIESNNEESVFMEIDNITPVQIEIDNIASSREINVVNHVIIGEPEVVINEAGDGFTFEVNCLVPDPTVSINDVTNALFNNHEISEPTETSELEVQDFTESTTSDNSHIGELEIVDLTSPDETDDWDVTNTSLGLPALSGILPPRNSPLSTRIYNGWSSMVRSRTRTRSGRRQVQL